MRKSRDPVLPGNRYGRLVVLSRGEDWVSKNTGEKNKQFFCQCDCGNTKLIAGRSLKSERTRSCGCLNSEISYYKCKNKTIHGQTCSNGGLPSREYYSWRTMIQRCKNPKNKDYKNYGGRGINVCDRWCDFLVFLSDMGSRPDKMTLDRIDNDLGYYPENCKWSTYKEQASNKRARNKWT